MRCLTCGEKISDKTFMLKWWKHQHYQTLHADYARWIGRWYRNFFAIPGLLLILLLAVFLASNLTIVSAGCGTTDC
jgi:hypothetical protein